MQTDDEANAGRAAVSDSSSASTLKNADTKMLRPRSDDLVLLQKTPQPRGKKQSKR